MTPEKMNIAIAGARGWVPHPEHKVDAAGRLFNKGPWWRLSSENTIATTEQLPNYSGSLDAMHEAEMNTEGLDEEKYYAELSREVLGRDICCEHDHSLIPFATAPQRAKALLRTLDAYRAALAADNCKTNDTNKSEHERDALKAENERITLIHGDDYRALAAELFAARKRVAELEKDRARMDWLQKHNTSTQSLRVAIDAAINQEAE